MEPRHETSVQLPSELHEFLLRVAEERGIAVGDLIRSAVESRFETRTSVAAYPQLDQIPKDGWSLPTFDAPHW